MVSCRAAFALVFVAAATFSSGAFADQRLTGSFVAQKDCPALQSFRRSTNPGNVTVKAGNSYPLVAKNVPDATHYRIEIAGVVPAERWVAAECGKPETEGQSSNQQSKGEPTPNLSAELILSLSWEPSFCATMPAKVECSTETADGFDATHLSLHGLWPQPRGRQYCNVDRAIVDADRKHDWAALPEVSLDPDVRSRLDQVMPGTQSLLERHEWIRHGTCYFGSDSTSYFREAEQLVDEVNNSKVQALFADHVGRQLSADDIRAAFDASFGTGAGARVKVLCKRDGSRRFLTEITVGLGGRPSGDRNLSDLILAARETDRGCPSGELAITK